MLLVFLDQAYEWHEPNAAVLTLIVIPAVYLLWKRQEIAARSTWSGG